MKTQTVRSERRVYLLPCPKCSKEIKGFSESHAKRNLKYHFDKCRKEILK